MTEHPPPYALRLNVVKEMIGEPVKITATMPASIKVEIRWVLDGLANPDLELREEVVSKLRRYLIILFEDSVQIHLNSPVKPSFHGA